MQPATLSASSGEDRSTELHTLSSSLHTLSPASLRELLLSCALENEQVATYIHVGINSPNIVAVMQQRIFGMPIIASEQL